MSKVKAIIDFTIYRATELIPVAKTIHDKLVTGASLYSDPPVDMPTLASRITAFEAALAKKASGAHVDVSNFNITRHNLEVALATLGGYVNHMALGDLASVQTSGFPFYNIVHASSGAAASADVVLRHGDLSGSIVARCKPDRRNSVNEIQTNTGDPTVEVQWQRVGTFGGGKAVGGGLTAGSALWVRVRTFGAPRPTLVSGATSQKIIATQTTQDAMLRIKN